MEKSKEIISLDAGKKCFAVSEMKDAGRSLMKKLAGVK